jgi:muramidase (phage lysozyme)
MTRARRQSLAVAEIYFLNGLATSLRNRGGSGDVEVSMQIVLRILMFVFTGLLGCMAQAEAVSILGASLLNTGRGSLFVAARSPQTGQTAALFIDRDHRGLFSDRPAHALIYAAVPAVLRGTDVQVIRALIQEAESRRDGYDAVQHGARIKPRKRPTQMTLAEIFAWIKATQGQPHAIGRYQFVPQTLRRVVAKVGVKPNQRFDAKMQDKLADVLLAEAGLHKFRTGALGRKAFMNNLAKIWAGLPNTSGKSHYEGYAGNKASITLRRFDAVMARISPDRG